MEQAGKSIRSIIEEVIREINWKCGRCGMDLAYHDAVYCVPCKAIVDAEERAKREAERLAADAAEMDAYRRAYLCRVPPAYRCAALAGIDERTGKAIDRWNGAGFLYLHGPTGCGKTWAAWAVANSIADTVTLEDARADRRHPKLVKFADFCGAVTRERFNDQTDPAASLAWHDNLVIVDDVAACSCSEYERAQFLRVVDTRNENQRATIYTTNLAPGELARALDDRLASRMASGVVHKMSGGDRRMAGKDGGR